MSKSISKFMAFVHMSVNDMSKQYLMNERRYNYTTPKSFLELVTTYVASLALRACCIRAYSACDAFQINLYRNLLSKKHRELISKMERLEGGLEKLKSTASQVRLTNSYQDIRSV